MSVNIEKLYQQELKMESIFYAIKKGFDTVDKIFQNTEITRTSLYHYLGKLDKLYYIKTIRFFNKDNGKWSNRFHAVKDEFRPASYETLLEKLQSISNEKVVKRTEKKGPYDDLIQSNPNLKKYSPFDNGYKNVRIDTKVNRSAGCSFALYDLY